MAAGNDDSTLFVVLLVGILGCPFVVYFGWKRWKHKASERWPLVAAQYQGARIGERSNPESGSIYYVALNFSYEVSGKTYLGKYRKIMPGYNEGEVNAQLRSLEEGPLFVRHHPSNPRVYVCDPFRDVRPT